MENYDFLSKCFDEVTGSRAEEAEHLRKIITKYNPEAANILDMACGTGSLLKYFEKDYDVYGFDLSVEMLSLAHKKIPTGDFTIQNMCSFTYNRKFDVILCTYDAINHLLTFKEWKMAFRCVLNHLNDDGVFIFDMHTRYKLNLLIQKPASILFLKNKNILVTHITAKSDEYLINWNVKFFERKCHCHNEYLLYEENIKEIGFPFHDVKNALKKFQILEITDSNGGQCSRKTERVIFVCKKK